MAEEVPWGVALVDGRVVWTVMASTAEGAVREWARKGLAQGLVTVGDSQGLAVAVWTDGQEAVEYVVRVTVQVEKGED